MRVVGGSLRGRALLSPKSRAIRPTSDRLRESLFNILAHSFDNVTSGARVLDLFAGTGALGIEALSRGADFAMFVDSSDEAQSVLGENLTRLGLSSRSRPLRADAAKLAGSPQRQLFTLAFLDPPYACDLVRPTLEALRRGAWLMERSLVIVEESRKAIVAPPASFEYLDQRLYGDTQIVFLRFQGEGSGDRRDSPHVAIS
jgi:16S rRNA (guanine966-N2)-methyltransferase